MVPFLSQVPCFKIIAYYGPGLHRVRTRSQKGVFVLLALLFTVCLLVSFCQRPYYVQGDTGTAWWPLSSALPFNPHGKDTLVFIHIPKTGGSYFLQQLVTLELGGKPLCSLLPHLDKQRAWGYCPRNGDVKNIPVRKSNDPWLVAEKTIGWHCGLHPFYSEYRSCVSMEKERRAYGRKFDPTSRLHYSTVLRHPVLRYIGEYLHVQRGATFSYRHTCNGREVQDAEMPPCYPGYYSKSKWPNVTLPLFLSCESNWGNNRQTMSLADLENAGCFNKSKLPQAEREKRLLQSAKDNLKNFAFFGITEFQVESALLFEKTFGMQFKNKTHQKPVTELHSAPMLSSLWKSTSVYDKIAQVNHLDMQLYDYALELFESRLQTIGITLNQTRLFEEIKLLPSDNDALKAKKKYRNMNFDLNMR